MAYYNDYETKNGYIVRKDASGNEYYTDAKGNRVNQITNNSGGSSGSSYPTTVTPDTSAADAAYDKYIAYIKEQQAAAERERRAAINQGVNKLESQRPVLEQMFKDSARDAYVQKMMSQKNLPQQLAAQGINGGMSESSNLALETGYGNAYNNLQQQYNSGLNQIDSDIANLKATGDISLAETANQYAQKMADIALQQMQYQQSLASKQASGIATDEYKPKLSFSDVMKEIERGNTSEGIRKMYEYYTDTPYTTENQVLSSSKVQNWIDKANTNLWKLSQVGMSKEDQIAKALEQAVNTGYLTIEEANAIGKYFGV